MFGMDTVVRTIQGYLLTLPTVQYLPSSESLDAMSQLSSSCHLPAMPSFEWLRRDISTMLDKATVSPTSLENDVNTNNIDGDFSHKSLTSTKISQSKGETRSNFQNFDVPI